jgi:hypothetical protein
MRKNIAILTSALAMLMLAGCGKIDREVAKITGNAREICHKGVVYLQFTSGASVMYTPDGKVATCM